MKKNKIYLIFTICILFTIPIVKFSVAQPPTYVGVEEGDEYIWKINIDIDGVDQLVNNTRQFLVDQRDNISTIDLNGFESLNISESIEIIIDTALNMTFPPGWESKNISSLIKELFQTYGGGAFNLNFSAFFDYVIDGLNSIMPSGWENFTLQELVYSALPTGWENHNITELVYSIINELNTSLIQGRLPQGWENLTLLELGLYTINELLMLPPGWENLTITEFVYSAIDMLGILPPGWENETISDLIQGFLLSVIPEGFSFNFLLESLDFLLPLLIPDFQYSIDQLFALTFPPEILNLNVSTVFEGLLSLFIPGGILQYSIDDLFALLIPPEFLNYSIDDLFALLPPEILNLNISAVIDSLAFFLDSILPPGWDSQSLTSLIYDLVDLFIGMLDPGVASMEISTLIELLIDDFIVPYMYYPLSAYIGPLPLGWESLTISELLWIYMDNYILSWDNTIIAQWTSLRSLIESSGILSNEMGLKARVNDIKDEVLLSPGGPRGVPINMTLFFSLDMENWVPIPEILDSFGINLSFFTALPMLVDPSTYSNELIAFIDQMPFTGGLIIANNYGLELNTQDIVIPITGDPNGIVISAEWTNQGLLKSASIEVSGITAFSIELVIEQPGGGAQEIPGYNLYFLLILFPVITAFLIRKRLKKI